jgi:hypothetical protein
MKRLVSIALFSVFLLLAVGSTDEGSSSKYFDEENPSYREGFSDGYIVGRADKRDGRERRGLWAKENGERLSQGHSGDKKAYAAGYHVGYNEGWHSY